MQTPTLWSPNTSPLQNWRRIQTVFVIEGASGLDTLDKQKYQTSKQKAASLEWCWEWGSGVDTQLLYSPLKECHLRADCRKRKSTQKQAFTWASEIPLNYLYHEWSNFAIIGLKKKINQWIHQYFRTLQRHIVAFSLGVGHHQQGGH